MSKDKSKQNQPSASPPPSRKPTPTPIRRPNIVDQTPIKSNQIPPNTKLKIIKNQPTQKKK